METVRYLRALKRSWWLIVLALVAGGAGGFLIFHRATPLYRSAVTSLVVQKGVTGASPATAVTSLQDFTSELQQIAGSQPAVADAVRAAGVTGGSQLSVSVSASQSLLTISVSDSDPAVAFAVADAFPKTLPGSLNRLTGDAASGVRLNVINQPSLATAPYSPQRDRDIGLGLVVGLVVGLALAIVRETLDRSVPDSGALKSATGLTVLGTVPRDSKKVLLPARSAPRSARAEGYRQVRTSILSRTTRRPLVLSVTSAAGGEGKTSVACNLAAMFSRTGETAVIVDADLRRPRVGKFFGLQRGPGLSDVLLGRADLRDALVELDDGRLGVLQAGRIPDEPSEILGSKVMLQVLQELANTYEFVLVDTPPVLPVTDGLVVAPMMDGVIFVSKLQDTTVDRIERALDALERVHADVIGVVPNQASAGADRDYRYTYRRSASDFRRGRTEEARTRPRDGDDKTGGPDRHDAEALVRKYRTPRETRPANTETRPGSTQGAAGTPADEDVPADAESATTTDPFDEMFSDGDPERGTDEPVTVTPPLGEGEDGDDGDEDEQPSSDADGAILPGTWHDGPDTNRAHRRKASRSRSRQRRSPGRS